MASEFAEVSFGLAEILVMRYVNASNTYTGALVNWETDQLYSCEPQADTDDQRDSGAVVDGITIMTMASISVGYGAWHAAAVVTAFGATASSSGTTPNQVAQHDFRAGGIGLPYIGLIAASLTQDGGVLVVGHPKLKFNSTPPMEWDGKENQFHVAEVEGRAFAVSALTGMFMRVKRFETLATWTAAKPTTAAQFAAFFAG